MHKNKTQLAWVLVISLLIIQGAAAPLSSTADITNLGYLPAWDTPVAARTLQKAPATPSGTVQVVNKPVVPVVVQKPVAHVPVPQATVQKVRIVTPKEIIKAPKSAPRVVQVKVKVPKIDKKEKVNLIEKIKSLSAAANATFSKAADKAS